MSNYLFHFLTPDWLTAIGTVGACVLALVIALFGKRMESWFNHPELHLEADVQRPDAEKVLRWAQAPNHPTIVPVGEAWFLRLRISNTSDTPAREVQLYLRRVEKIVGNAVTVVERFSPMNLKWTHTGQTTRDVLLSEVPVFCDFIHIGDPEFKDAAGEDLDGVADGIGVMCLDVQVTTSGRGHLLEPGMFRCHLILAAENSRPLRYVVEVQYSGVWSENQDQMFDNANGFRMRKL